MPGPPPKKNPARRNRKATRAILRSVAAPKKPDLPARIDPLTDEPVGWHPMTVAWWDDLWKSPMAGEFVQSDVHGLFKLAVLEDDYWRALSPSARKDLASEIRLQRQCFGLTPLDRRRLQWEIERAEGAQEKSHKRRAKPPAKPKADPRAALAAVE